MEDLRVKVPHLPPGWQSTFDIRERAGRIMQLYEPPLFIPSMRVITCTVSVS